ncbi:tyrosine-type recombinase/integrase [Chitinivorax sp. B]|uniref:tyrosine-type recombinase/integrase n=1 Tax=Chitinivorax sp. B TaxID=2502235 RepID=UPI0020174A0A|nr:tyrosine-type recombinase/integrase [Chitinivorax sp. B]
MAPLDMLQLPSELDGSLGANRAKCLSQITADKDIEAVAAWLAQFADSPATFSNYRKEAERLLLWAVFERGKPLSSLANEDFLAYRVFLMDPQPTDRWVQAGGKRLSRAHAQWRPFAGPLSMASVRQALVTLNVMLSWLVEAGYLAGNPLALSRHRRRHAAPRVTRYLDNNLWAEVVATIEALPRDTRRACERADRIRWLFSLFYLAGVRISEVANNTMGGFFERSTSDGSRWWLDIIGKGNKQRLVPVSTELMAELIRYRRSHDLTSLPYPGEMTPLVLPIGGRNVPLKRAALHEIVKEVFNLTAQRAALSDPSPGGQARAERLQQASAHWLRHTAGTHMANAGVDLRFLRDNLGHENLTTSSGYLHSEDDARHQATTTALRIDWHQP